MKYISTLLFFLLCSLLAYGQGTFPPTFFDGKTIVLLSNDPGARPLVTWQALADSIHSYLVRAGGDPVAYYELEQVALSEERQSEYAKAFLQRQIQNLIFITRQKDQTSIHVGKFSGDGKLIRDASLFGVSGKDWQIAAQQFAAYGRTTPTRNLLVSDLAEFPGLVNQGAATGAQKFISRNPLNLEVFRLGIPVEGTSAVNGPISTFRYNAYGKSAENLLSEQSVQKRGLEEIFSNNYSYEVAWLTEAKSNSELWDDRIRFLLVRVEGRQADLMMSMGLKPLTGDEGQKTVIKYYIRHLARNEQYIGPSWDAHPDWRIALTQFLENLKK
jgi:hypothetical protein